MTFKVLRVILADFCRYRPGAELPAWATPHVRVDFLSGRPCANGVPLNPGDYLVQGPSSVTVVPAEHWEGSYEIVEVSE